MYRLLIVDDEAGHREGMTGLLRMLKPEYLVFEAESGERALQMMGTMSFDLVLTDIRMSGMDGLTFLQLAREKQPNARYAILSAYGTFEYARSGLAIGADDYLLKPVDVEELRVCLEKMENRLQDAQAARLEQERMQTNLRHMQTNYVEQQMYLFVMGELSGQEETMIRQVLGPGDSGSILYTVPENGWKDAHAQWDVRYLIRERLKAYGQVITFSPLPNANALVSVIVWRGTPLKEDELEAICQAVGQEAGQRLIIGEGRSEQGFFSRLRAGYHGAQSACMRHFFQPETYFLRAEEGAGMNPYQPVRLEVSLKELAMLLHDGESDAAYALLERGLRSLAADKDVSPSKVKEVTMYAFMFLLNDADLNPDAAMREQICARLDQAIPESRSFTQMLTIVREELQALSCQPEVDAPEASVLDEAVQYVRQHFCEPISLATVAQHFHYNPSYFSNQFKLTAGVPFSDFLTELRMNRAAELLLETNLYAAKVGERVGYPNAAYFTKAFKKRYHLSPDQYRKRRGRE